jgi:multidrug resistance efflux pump
MTTRVAFAMLLAGMVAAAAGPASAEDKPAEKGLVVSGYVVPVQMVRVGARVSGTVVEMHVQEGASVKAGQVLAKIDPTPYRHAVLLAEAKLQAAVAKLDAQKKSPSPEEVQQAKLAVREAEILHEAAEKHLHRVAGLANVVSEVERLEARSRAELSKLKLEQTKVRQAAVERGATREELTHAEAEVQVAKVELEQAKHALDSTNITSPIEGVVLRRGVSAGEIVAAGLNGPSIICEIADLRRLEVEVHVAEGDIARIAVGQPCQIHVGAYASSYYKGLIARVQPMVDPAKATIAVRVKIELPDGERKLLPGMRAQVRFVEAK